MRVKTYIITQQRDTIHDFLDFRQSNTLRRVVVATSIIRQGQMQQWVYEFF